MRATRTFTDRDGVTRKNGEEWLIKIEDTDSHIPDVYEEVSVCVCVRVRTVQKFQCRNPQVCYIKVHLLSPRLCSLSFFLVLHFFSLVQVVGIVKITTLNNRQYCVILDPVGKDGKPQLGQKKLIKGERSFFLSPGERLEKGTQNVYVLEEDEGLILKANEAFTDADTVSVVILSACSSFFFLLLYQFLLSFLG